MTEKNSPAGAEGLVAKWRERGAEAERIFAENSAKMQRGEMVTFDVTSGPFVAIENKFADELEAVPLRLRAV